MTDLSDLPGGTLVEQGLRDTRSGRTSVESLLVAISAPRLQALGLDAYGPPGRIPDPELSLYALLGQDEARNPYSRYNALLRELASFVHALEHRVARDRRTAETSGGSRTA